MAAAGNRTAGAVIYTRVSTEDQAQHGTSLAGQRDACRAKSLSLGLPIVAECEDAGVSGALFVSRPGLQSTLAAIESGRADTLICYELSRLSRVVRDQQDIRERVKMAGGRLVFCDMTFEDTDEGELNYDMQGSFKAYERKTIRKRTMNGKRRRAEEGQQPQRSRPPFGYHIVTNAEVECGLFPPAMRGKYLFDEAHKPVALRIWADYQAGVSLTRLAKALNEEGIPTPGHGRRWLEATLRVILTNPAYKGQPVSGRQKCHQDERRLGERHKLNGRPILRPEVRRIVPEGQRLTLSAPALVSPEAWEEVQGLLARGRGTKSGTPRHVRMLSGQTTCPHCGGRAGFKYQTANGKKYSYLTCRQRLAARVEGGEKPCVGDLYPVEEVEAATLMAIRRAWECPEAAAAALAVYRQEPCPMTDEAGEDLRPISEALDALKREEVSVVQAQMAGIRSGASPDAYAELFADIATRRKDLASRRREIEASARREVSAPAQEASTGAVTAAFREAWEVLTHPDVPGVAKRDILLTLVERVVCQKGGADVVFRPGVFGEQEEILTLHTTCIGISTQR